MTDWYSNYIRPKFFLEILFVWKSKKHSIVLQNSDKNAEPKLKLPCFEFLHENHGLFERKRCFTTKTLTHATCLKGSRAEQRIPNLFLRLRLVPKDFEHNQNSKWLTCDIAYCLISFLTLQRHEKNKKLAQFPPCWTCIYEKNLSSLQFMSKIIFFKKNRELI